MFDTHCHLNFSRFQGKVDAVVGDALVQGVTHILVPGTDVESSQRAVDIANQYENAYAAVGIHPHHVYKFGVMNYEFGEKIDSSLIEIEQLLKRDKVVAVGEVGVDRHPYRTTKYKPYSVDEKFIELQKELLMRQIDLALQYDKSLILHNREAKQDLYAALGECWDDRLRGKTVFHCCEPDEELLAFAREHDIYIGIDGDITYTPEKQEFVKKVPLDKLVLETDAPFLLPEPLRSQKRFPNEPKNLVLIAEFIAEILKVPFDKLTEITMENSKRVFSR